MGLKGPPNLSSVSYLPNCAEVSTYANNYLKLIKQTTLGNKDTIIELPLDTAIYNEIFYTGNYSPSLTKYIAQFINFSNVDRFIDLGANSGLVTRGIVHQLNKNLECILVEPFPDLMHAIKTNLSNMENRHFVFKQFALSNLDGEILFCREINNCGSGTMNKRLGSITKHNEFTLPSRKASLFLTEIFAEDKKVVIKSDLQAHIAEILSMVPELKIRNVLLIICELWSNSEIKLSQVHKFLDKFENEFSFIF